MSKEPQIEITTKRLFFVPKVPNFLRCSTGENVSIGELNPDQVTALAEAWRDALQLRVHQVRKQKP